MVDNICQAYHWSLKDVMRLTIPQMIMLGHAAAVNSLRTDKRMEAKSKADEIKRKKDETDPIVMNGKRLSQLTPEEEVAYYSNPVSFN